MPDTIEAIERNGYTRLIITTNSGVCYEIMTGETGLRINCNNGAITVRPEAQNSITVDKQ